MIAPLTDKGQGQAASFVVRNFRFEGIPHSAVLHISALGLYRCFLNGMRVSEDLLTPGWTCYDDRIAYQSYEVSNLLRPGENRIEIWLADGWYRSPVMWREAAIVNCWGTRIGAIAELTADGRTLLSTAGDWRSGTLPILKSGIYFGEIFDARLFPVHDSHGVEILAFDQSLLVPHEAPPLRELVPFMPIDHWTDAEGREVYDFGQNVAGYVRYTVRGEAGAEVLVEHSEVLGPKRQFDNRNYRCAEAQTLYTLSGRGEETYAPMFTFQGFRYARVTVRGRAEILAIASVPISSVHGLAGGFESGHALVNQLVRNTVWSLRSNFVEVPTDCPQRDERLGWTGDAQVFAGTACWLANSQRFLSKYLRDVMADQRADGAIAYVSPDPTRQNPHYYPNFAGSPGWGDAIVIIPWVLYTHYADRDVLLECLPAMLKWLDYLWSISDGPIVRPTANYDGKHFTEGFSFGDWLQPVGDSRKPRPTIGDDCAATIYHFISTNLVARIAGVLGRPDLQNRMAERAEQIRQAFAHEYIAPSGRLGHDDQTSYALALLHDLVPSAHREAAKRYFRTSIENANYTIGTGFIGTPALLPALTKVGMDDLAAKMLLQTDAPGWLYQVTQGATTIWERWDSMAPDGTIYEPTMNSFNHYAYGAVCQWLFESVAGIAPDPEKPGFARVLVDPAPIRELSPVSVYHDVTQGRIEAGWKIEGDEVTYRLTLPVGCEARFQPGPRHAGVRLDGTSIESEVMIGAGTHHLTFSLLPGVSADQSRLANLAGLKHASSSG